jgi:cytosine/adenosine deaminase-related metal-dependent hydrolase
MWMFGKGGMTPLEAIRTATANPAHYLGMDKEIGSLEVGKLADLVILDGDILTDIRQSDQIHRVMLNGRLYDPATMNEVGQRSRARKPFFFEGAEGVNVPVRVRAHAHGDED